MPDTDKLAVAITRDFLNTRGDLYFDQSALEDLRAEPGIKVQIMDDPAPTRITADHAAQFHMIIMKRSPLPAEALGRMDQRLVLVARNGVGVDHLDVAACTRNGVMIAVTPEAVRRPVASSIVAFILALAHRIPLRDQMTRSGRWAERNNVLGTGLAGKTLGMIGVGNIGGEVFRLVRPWGMIHLGCDPHAPPEGFPELGVRLVDLDTLLVESDFVCLCCPYTTRTHRLIGARELGLMKPSAYFINTARGEIVHEDALIRSLSEHAIAGAAIDVFEKEPPRPDNPLFEMDQVIVSSHNISLSPEGNRLGNRAVVQAARAIAQRAAPKHIINPDACHHPRIRDLLNTLG